MNQIKKIKIENIKGKDKLEVSLENVFANKPNLMIAPNGFGKSTITKAFASVKPTKVQLANNDLYSKSPTKLPSLSVVIKDDSTEKTFIANHERNDFHNKIDIQTINSSVIAKSSYATAGADLKIEPIILYKKIPIKTSIDYNINSIYPIMHCEKKILINLDNVLNDENNINSLYKIIVNLNKFNTQKTVNRLIEDFINTIPKKGTANEIKDKIPQKSVDILLSNRTISDIYETVKKLNFFNTNTTNIDYILSTLQIIYWFKTTHKKDNKHLKKLMEYLNYNENKRQINERLKLFNTTGREIKAKKENNQLVIKFRNANTLSNGERDVLVFLSKLFCFEINMKSNTGILVIDEIFDYLDGSNMLVAQYYLSEFLNKCRKKGKIVYALLFTHLDPNLFSNYYFQNKKINYLKEIPINCKDSDIVKIIQNRTQENISEFISKHLLHYHPEDITINTEIQTLTSDNFPNTTNSFRDMAYNEIKQKYLKNTEYNPILVIVGIRIKVEEIAYAKLSTEQQSIFIETHKTINKLEYASNYVELPELLYLLKPLYNSVHLKSDWNKAKNEVISCSLKLYNNPIKNLIEILFNL